MQSYMFGFLYVPCDCLAYPAESAGYGFLKIRCAKRILREFTRHTDLRSTNYVDKNNVKE